MATITNLITKKDLLFMYVKAPEGQGINLSDLTTFGGQALNLDFIKFDQKAGTMLIPFTITPSSLNLDDGSEILVRDDIVRGKTSRRKNNNLTRISFNGFFPSHTTANEIGVPLPSNFWDNMMEVFRSIDAVITIVSVGTINRAIECHLENYRHWTDTSGDLSYELSFVSTEAVSSSTIQNEDKIFAGSAHTIIWGG